MTGVAAIWVTGAGAVGAGVPVAQPDKVSNVIPARVTKQDLSPYFIWMFLCRLSADARRTSDCGVKLPTERTWFGATNNGTPARAAHKDKWKVQGGTSHSSQLAQIASRDPVADFEVCVPGSDRSPVLDP